MKLPAIPPRSAVLLAVAFALLPAMAGAASTVIVDSGSQESYYYPGDWASPASANYPRMFFNLPGSLLGATVNQATLSFTGQMYGSGPLASVELIRNPAPNSVVANDVVYPFNYGQFAQVDVRGAVAAWVATGSAATPNLGLLVKLDGVFADLPTGSFWLDSYRPRLSIEYSATAASQKAGLIDAAGRSALTQNWDFADVATLYGAYAAGPGAAVVVDGETWIYTANEYSTGGSWGGPHTLGDAWVDASGYKHIYLGSGLTTAPVPEPLVVAQMLAGLAALSLLGAGRRRRAR